MTLKQKVKVAEMAENDYQWNILKSSILLHIPQVAVKYASLTCYIKFKKVVMSLDDVIRFNNK